MFLSRRILVVLLAGLLVFAAGCGSGGSGPGAEDPQDPPVRPAGPDLRLNTDPAGFQLSVFPEICRDGGRIYVVWYDRRAGDMDIHFNRSLDGGATWLDDDRRLDTDEAGAAGSNVPRLCCAGENVYVAWSDQRGVLSEIRFNRSVDAGATWLEDDLRLDRAVPEEGSSWNPDVCCRGDDVYVVWQDSRNGLPDVYFNHSADGGLTWLEVDVRLDTDVGGAAASQYPRIVCCGDAVHVVWQDDRDGEPDIRYNQSIDCGATWFGGDVRLDVGDEAGAAASVEPRLVCDGTRVCVVWSDRRNGERDVFFNASADAGATFFADDRRLDTDPPGGSASLVPMLCCRGAEVFVVWEDFRSGQADVAFNRSEDGGATWLASDLRLDTDPPGTASSLLPQVACGDDRLYVAWYDNRSGAFDVLVTMSADGGGTWLDEEVRLDTDEAGATNSLAPRVASDAGEAVVVWYDQRDGPGDIRFNRTTSP